MRCKICGSTNIGACIKARDLNYGRDGVFEYFQCRQCLCLQIKEIPNGLGRYYGKKYYSLHMGRHQASLPEAMVAAFLKIRDKRLLSGKDGILKKLCCKLQPRAAYEYIYKICRNRNTPVLDVGCGDGYLLKMMHSIGYKNLTGADPYLLQEERGGVKLIRGDIFSIQGKYGLVMLHHSLEHMGRQREIFEKIAKLLKDKNSVCMVCVPVCTGYAFEKYRENWVQLDAPRHLFLHSPKSIRYLAAHAGMRVVKVIYDSNSFQFIGSEMYQKGIAGTERRKLKNCLLYAGKSVLKYSKMAEIMNEEKRGDQAVFILKLR